MKAKNTRYKKILVFSAFTLDFCEYFADIFALYIQKALCHMLYQYLYAYTYKYYSRKYARAFFKY